MMMDGSQFLGAMITPALWFAGLGAVAAPILIHLLARRRFKRIRWAAMDFLLEAQRRNRRRLRMEEWILLAMRCAAIAMIGAMLARPFLQPSGVAAALSGPQRSERLFLLDDSLSMAYAESDGSPWQDSKEAVRRVVESVRRDAPDDTVTTLCLTAPETPVDAGTLLSDAQTADLLSRVEALSPTRRSFDPASALPTAAKILDQNPGVTNAIVYVLSDFQRSQWLRGGEGATRAQGESEGGGLLDSFADWAKENRGLRVVLVDLGKEGRSNQAVTALDPPNVNAVAGANASIRAAVLNDSDAELRDVDLAMSLTQVQLASQRVESIGARQTVNVNIELEFPRAGWEHVRVETPADALPADNARHLAVEVLSALRVLVVNGEPATEAITDEVAFLSTALRPEGELFSGNEVTIIDESQLADAKLEEFHLVIVANVFALSEPVVESLEGFVRMGGGLLVFLGDQVDVEAYNALLYRDGGGLLPGRLLETRAPAEPVRLIVDDRLHPAMAGLARDGDPLGLGQIPFERYMALALAAPTDEPADAPGANDSPPADTSLPGSQGVGERSRTRIVAHFSDTEESPAMVDRSFGEGRVMLVTTSADKEWNLWPDHPTYLPAMMEMCQYMARSRRAGGAVTIGQPIELAVDLRRFELDVRVRTPGFPAEPESVIPATVGESGGAAIARWANTAEAGVYQFVFRNRDGSEEARWIAVNVDPVESRLAPCSDAELRRAMGETPYEHVKGLDAVTSTVGDSRMEVWRMLLIAAAALLIGEQSLAWWWGRRRS